MYKKLEIPSVKLSMYTTGYTEHIPAKLHEIVVYSRTEYTKLAKVGMLTSPLIANPLTIDSKFCCNKSANS